MINQAVIFLKIEYPDGRQENYPLSSETNDSRITIGRLNDNDIVLQPDPGEMVSRYHCYIIKKGYQGFWRIVDEGSTNGTWLRHPGLEDQDVRQHRDEGCRLHHEDVILIYSLSETPPFKLTFWDEQDPTKKPVPESFLEYDLSQRKLFIVQGKNRYFVKLTPLQRKMVDYMAQQNYQHNQNKPMLCKHQDLVFAIWGDDLTKTNSDVANLIFRLEKEIADKYPVNQVKEFASQSPRIDFFESIRNEGYILNVKLID